jgi:hypothetical protein
MLIAFTYLPGLVTMVFRGMPTVWRGRHRLIFFWLIFMQAIEFITVYGLWYAVPPLKGGTTYGRCTIH